MLVNANEIVSFMHMPLIRYKSLGASVIVNL